MENLICHIIFEKYEMNVDRMLNDKYISYWQIIPHKDT